MWCNGDALFAENKLYELYNLCDENQVLFCGEIRHFKKLGSVNQNWEPNVYLVLVMVISIVTISIFQCYVSF